MIGSVVNSQEKGGRVESVGQCQKSQVKVRSEEREASMRRYTF